MPANKGRYKGGGTCVERAGIRFVASAGVCRGCVCRLGGVGHWGDMRACQEAALGTCGGGRRHQLRFLGVFVVLGAVAAGFPEGLLVAALAAWLSDECDRARCRSRRSRPRRARLGRRRQLAPTSKPTSLGPLGPQGFLWGAGRAWRVVRDVGPRRACVRRARAVGRWSQMSCAWHG